MGMPPDRSIIPPGGEQQPPQQGKPAMKPGQVQQPGQSPGNAITAQIKEELSKNSPPDQRANIQRLVAAGRRLMFDPKTHGKLLERMKVMEGNADDKIAQAAATLITLIKAEAKGPFPLPAAFPAAVILMCEIIEFFEESGKLEVTEQLVAETMQELTGLMMQKLRIGPEEIRQAQQALPAGGAQGETQQPQQPPPQPQQQQPQPPQGRGIL